MRAPSDLVKRKIRRCVIQGPCRLITIGLSHYCEKARWALTLSGVDWREEAHGPGFHGPAIRRAGGRRTAPALVTAEGVLSDSTDILRYLDGRLPQGRRFFPNAESEALEARFDDTVGPHTRRFAYHHMLGRRGLTLPLMQHGVPRFEAAVLWLLYPLLAKMMRRGMRIDEAGAARSRATLEAEVAFVNGLLADGRPYLAGAAFSAADLTFAALFAPVLCVPEYAWPLPPIEALPPVLQEDVRRWRESPAGQHVLRVYATARAAWPT
jgi:glutathione S-transferase